jgi:glutathione S-transferase
VGREAASYMTARGRGTMLFTGATASVKGRTGFAAFSSAKFELRAVAQSMARELGPKNIHIVHLLIDAGADSEAIHQRMKAANGTDALEIPQDSLTKTISIAEAYWFLHGLIPEKKVLQAKWLEWCFFIIAELDSTSLYVMHRHSMNNGLAHIYGEAPAVVSQAGEYFRHQLRYVDLALSDGRTYLLGDRFTTADIIPKTCLTRAIDYSVEICNSAVPYLERTKSRPAYQFAAVANTPRK